MHHHGESNPSLVEGWGASAHPQAVERSSPQGCAEMETPKPLCLKPGAEHLPVLTTKTGGKKKIQPLKKGQNLCHSCQPANIHRKFTGLRSACGQMSAWDAIAQAPPTAFWQSCSLGMAAGLGWVLEKAAPHHPPSFACSCGTAVSGPFVLQRALDNEPKHTLGTARSSSALFGGDTVEFWDKLPNPKPGCLACKEWKNPIGNRGVTSH